ncbi:MAG: hypothetical protein QNJ53_16420 [Pleurocapsa sp. MO_192.B19]|nr:hypothetical protein [Pleurocapsa sp. MO_192.B19]
MDKVLQIIVAGASAIFLFLLLIRLRYDRLVKEIWCSLRSQPSGLVFNPDMVADLDESVQRYFLHAIAPGTPLATYVEIEMRGSFRSKPDADWLPMKASQIISISPGFIWQPNVGKGGMNFSGADYYYRGQGRTKFSLWGLIPLVDARSKDVNRSAAGRLGAEYIWFPSALLPQYNVAWKAVAKNTIQANFQVDDELVVLTLTIDAEGKLLEISLPRWSDAREPGQWQYSTFITEVEAEQTFGGYTIPRCVSAGWLDVDRTWIFFKSNIQTAEFN